MPITAAGQQTVKNGEMGLICWRANMSKFLLSNLTLVTAICVVIFWLFMALGPANASWQIVPGKTEFGWSCKNCKEPCWSAATSRCAREQSRQKALDQLNRAKRISR